MKGIGFVNVREFVLQEFGGAQLERVLRVLPEADRRELSAAVAVGWYEVPMFGRLLRAVDGVCGAGDFKLVRRVGAFGAERDFHRALRPLLRVVSTEHLLKIHQRLWQHFQASGRWEAHRDGPRQVTLTLHDWEVDEVLCIELGAYCARMVEFSGGESASFDHTSCRARGGESCTFRARWR